MNINDKIDFGRFRNRFNVTNIRINFIREISTLHFPGLNINRNKP